MTTLKVSSPAELISAVPFLIGFHPVDSLIVVALHGPRITFAVRTDLPEQGTPDDAARAVVLHLASVVLRQQVEAVAIIGYGAEPRVTPAVLHASDAFGKAALDIVDELRVEDGRYWSYLCADRSCCPAEGRPCQPPDSVVAAEATFAGAVALPNREALEAQLAPVTGDDREAMTVATARAMLRLAALASDCPPASGSESASGLESASVSHQTAGDPPCAGPPPTTTKQSQPRAGGNRVAAGNERPDSSGGRPGQEGTSPPGREGTGPHGQEGTALHGDRKDNALHGDRGDSALPGDRRDAASSGDRGEAASPGGSGVGWVDLRFPAHVTRLHGFPLREAGATARSQAAHSPTAPGAGPGSCRPGPAELHLDGVIGARLGIAPPAPDAPEPGTGSADLLSNEDLFFARVRSAGRLAVREAERCYSTGGRLTDDAAAWLGVLLLHMPVRDYAWTRTRTQDWELALWSDLARRVEPRYLPAPAALLAFVAWRSGLGPLASIAVERALDQKPDYSLAALLHHALIIGLPPSVLDGWPAVQGLALVDDCPGSEPEARFDEAVSSEQEARSDEAVSPEKEARPDDTVGSEPEVRPDETASPEQARGYDPGRSAPPSDGPGGPQPAGRSENQPAGQETAQPTPPGQARPAEREPASQARQSRQGSFPPPRIRADAPSAGPRERAGGKPNRRAKRQPNPRRTAHRRT